MQAAFQLSADSKTLASVLREVGKDDTISYEALSRAIGRNVRSECAGALHSARLLVQREDRMVFDSVRGVGLMRLADSAIVDLADKARDKVRKHAKRTAKKLVCVDFDALPNDKKIKHNAALSMFGVMSEIATDKSMKRLVSQPGISTHQLPAAKAAMAALAAIA